MQNNQTIRKVGAGIIKKLVDYRVEVTALAAMLEVTRPTIYNWLGGFFLPSLERCEKIEELSKRWVAIKEDWTDIVTAWNGKYHRATLVTLYKKPARKILDSDLELDEKIIKLTTHTFNSWAGK